MRKLFRFSVRELLLLVTIIAMAVCLWIANDKRQTLEVENQRLRDEAGYLTIVDPKKAHAIEIPVTGAFRWKWRVHLPIDRDHRLCIATGDIPEIGPLPKGVRIGSTPIGINRDLEFIVEVAVEKNYDGQYCVAARGGPIEATPYWFDRDSVPPWLAGKAMIGINTPAREKTVSVERDKPLVLLRLYSRPTAKGEPGGGLQIWIEEWIRKKK